MRETALRRVVEASIWSCVAQIYRMPWRPQTLSARTVGMVCIWIWLIVMEKQALLMTNIEDTEQERWLSLPSPTDQTFVLGYVVKAGDHGYEREARMARADVIGLQTTAATPIKVNEINIMFGKKSRVRNTIVKRSDGQCNSSIGYTTNSLPQRAICCNQQ